MISDTTFYAKNQPWSLLLRFSCLESAMESFFLPNQLLPDSKIIPSPNLGRRTKAY